jgi:2-acylglycerol O-acyltransferase 2
MSLSSSSSVRFVPIYSHLLRLLGSVDASVPALDRALSEGSSLGLTPGGIAEMFWSYPQPNCHPLHEYAVLASRKGFIRLAIKHGVDLCPVFCFGASKMFRSIALPSIVQTISRTLQISLVAFFGRWGMPIPFATKTMYALGPRIPTAPYPLVGGEPSTEVVDFLHRTFVVALEDTFNRHKSSFGWSNRELIIV